MIGRNIQGYCPMGCGATLFLGNGGHVTCSWHACPDPAKADEILSTRESEHIVEIEENRFQVLHPLRERGEELFECSIHEQLGDLDGPPAPPGRYRVTRSRSSLPEIGNALQFERLS